MDIILISMLPLLVPIAFLLVYGLRCVICPDCGDTLPVIVSPFKKTRRMWRAGGFLCARCGCETNPAGQKVTADTPPAPFPTFHCALAALFLLVGVGLVACTLHRVHPEPPVVAAPLVFGLPPAAPVN
jgi:hypothetical protein